MSQMSVYLWLMWIFAKKEPVWHIVTAMHNSIMVSQSISQFIVMFAQNSKDSWTKWVWSQGKMLNTKSTTWPLLHEDEDDFVYLIFQNQRKMLNPQWGIIARRTDKLPGVRLNMLGYFHRERGSDLSSLELGCSFSPYILCFWQQYCGLNEFTIIRTPITLLCNILTSEAI